MKLAILGLLVSVCVGIIYFFDYGPFKRQQQFFLCSSFKKEEIELEKKSENWREFIKRVECQRKFSSEEQKAVKFFFSLPIVSYPLALKGKEKIYWDIGKKLPHKQTFYYQLREEKGRVIEMGIMKYLPKQAVVYRQEDSETTSAFYEQFLKDMKSFFPEEKSASINPSGRQNR